MKSTYPTINATFGRRPGGPGGRVARSRSTNALDPEWFCRYSAAAHARLAACCLRFAHGVAHTVRRVKAWALTRTGVPLGTGVPFGAARHGLQEQLAWKRRSSGCAWALWGQP